MRGISLVGFALIFASLATAGEPKKFLGFRLLDLESQTVKWRSARFGEGAALTYAYANGPVNTKGARNCARMVAPSAAYQASHVTKSDFRTAVAAAFGMWEKAANLAFREISDPAKANIVIGAQADPVGRAYTNVELKPAPESGRKVIARSLICLNPERRWKIGFDGDLDVYDLRYTIAHEIGHAIGLDHPSASGVLMSYRYDERHSGLQAGDIKGAALLYGRRRGDDSVAGSSPDITTGSTDALPNGRRFGLGDYSDKPARPAPTR